MRARYGSGLFRRLSIRAAWVRIFFCLKVIKPNEKEFHGFPDLRCKNLRDRQHLLCVSAPAYSVSHTVRHIVQSRIHTPQFHRTWRDTFRFEHRPVDCILSHRSGRTSPYTSIIPMSASYKSRGDFVCCRALVIRRCATISTASSLAVG